MFGRQPIEELEPVILGQKLLNIRKRLNNIKNIRK